MFVLLLPQAGGVLADEFTRVSELLGDLLLVPEYVSRYSFGLNSLPVLMEIAEACKRGSVDMWLGLER